MSDAIQAVITANVEQQRLAAALNVRSGENLFPVLRRTELSAWLAERLNGARCVREIPNVDALRLPPLDSEVVTLVTTENPEQIELLGQTYQVEYRTGYAPSITLACEPEGPHTWNDLPDADVRLPGGRLVAVSVQIDWYSRANGTDIPKLKEQVRSYLNQKLWDSWASKPAISLPDPNDEESVVPDITTAKYGQCVVEGTPLLAYGVVGLKGYRYYSSDPWFEAKWSRSLEEASTEREKAVVKLEELKTVAREAKQLAVAEAKAEATKTQVYEIYSAHYHSGKLSSDISSRLYSRSYAHLPSTVTDLRQWTAETNALMAEVERELTETQKREEEAARLREGFGSVLQGHYAECPICNQSGERKVGSADYCGDMEYCACLSSGNSEEAKQAVTAFEAETVAPTAFFEGRDAFVLRQTKLGDVVVAELLAFRNWRHWSLYLRAQPDAIRSGGELVTQTLWHLPSKLEIRLAELRKTRLSYTRQVEQAELDMADGYSFILRFRMGRNPKTGEEQLEAGNRGVKYILDRNTRLRVEPDKTYYCRERKRLVETSNFTLIVVEAMLEAGRDLDTEIAELETELSGEAPGIPIEEEVVEEKAEEIVDMNAMLQALKARFNH